MEWLCLCPFHEDSKASFSVNTVTGQWICYTGCGGGSLEQLEEKLGERGQWALIEEVVAPIPIRREPVLKSLLERGFTREMLSPWEIVWDEERNAMRIPVYRDGDVIANIWRYPEGITPKYRYEAGFEKSACLFGLWRLPKAVRQVVLVEGTLDTVWLQEAGHPAAAILGSSLSAAQIHLLQLRNIRTVVMCLDNDAAGKEATVRAAAMLRASGFWVFRTKLPARFKDIQEVPLEQVTEVMKRTELCVNHRGLYAPRFQRWVQAE